MSVQAVQCRGCGGAIAMSAGKTVPACLFCGEAALVPMGEVPQLPEQAIGFAVDENGARSAFQTFAGSSFWYPGDVKDARVELRKVFLPAWTWSGTVNTAYNAIVPAHGTRSGKRPVTGHDTLRMAGVLVPASSAVSRKELQAVAPFPVEAAQPFDEYASDVPFEVAQLTQTLARAEAERAMEDTHRARIQSQLSAHRVGAASLIDGLTGAAYLFPVFIGVYRYKDKPYRIVVNGQSGKITGTAPISWAKVAMVAFAVFAVLAILALVAGAGAGKGLH